MEGQRNQCEVPVLLIDHNYYQKRRMSTRQAGKHRPCNNNPCCRNDQVQNLTPVPQHSAPAANLRQKRKRSSEPASSRPSAERLGKANLAKKLRSAISPTDLPTFSNVTPSPQPYSANNQQSTADVNHNGPVKIHHYPMEDYQKIYHEVADDMLQFKSGRVRAYSLQLGRRIKQKLWERLDRPKITTSTNEHGLVHVDISYGAGVYPPLYNIDISREPKPGLPPNKRSRQEQ
ncbi:uncharacterized protein C22orf31-like [Trachinotus anak]|uniref:uncharacterized protein C22orf31-like n=1 Tax=Trachinotus anak TaxID=443729 RepID=UPI0039F1FB58